MKTSKSLQLCSFLLATSVSSLSAATVVFVNAQVTTYAGNETGFGNNDSVVNPSIGNQGFSPTGRYGYRFNLTGGEIWSQGEDIIPDNTSGSLLYRFDGIGNQPARGFTGGAVEGVNYVRYDGQNDGVFEAVFKVRLSNTNSQSIILSYAFNDPTENLSIPDAVSALNSIPEPSSTMLLGLGGLGLILRRKVVQ